MDWDDIANMTNKQAAAVLRKHLEHSNFPRRSGKTMLIATYFYAMMKAIWALESTPD